MKKVTFLLMAAVTFLTACDKDDDRATAERIMGKWDVANYTQTVFSGGGTTTTTVSPGPGSYIDFRNDGKYYTYLFGNYDTASYSVLSDSYLLMDGDSAAIRGISDHNLSLGQREYSGANYTDIQANLTR